MFYYAHHIGDFVKDTARLNDSQCMAYLRLIWLYYTQQSPLKNNTENLAFQIGSDPQTVGQLLSHYFYPDGDFWRHVRCDREILDYESKREKAKNSANARWTNANALRTQSERNPNATKIDANREPRTENQQPITKEPVVAAAKRRQQLPGDFYPNALGVTKSEEKGLSLAVELTKFSDYHRGKGSVMADWQAAWRTWIGNARPPTSTQTETAYQRSMRERVDKAIGRNRVYEPAPQFLEIEQ